MSSDGPAFVDTNITIYAYNDHDPRRSRIAVELLSRLIEEDRLRVSVQVLREFFNVSTRKLNPPLAVDDALREMRRLATCGVISEDESLVRRAAEIAQDNRISFWDGLIVAAAARSGADILYTEDLNHT